MFQPHPPPVHPSSPISTGTNIQTSTGIFHDDLTDMSRATAHGQIFNTNGTILINQEENIYKQNLGITNTTVVISAGFTFVTTCMVVTTHATARNTQTYNTHTTHANTHTTWSPAHAHISSQQYRHTTSTFNPQVPLLPQISIPLGFFTMLVKHGYNHLTRTVQAEPMDTYGTIPMDMYPGQGHHLTVLTRLTIQTI